MHDLSFLRRLGRTAMSTFPVSYGLNYMRWWGYLFNSSSMCHFLNFFFHPAVFSSSIFGKRQLAVLFLFSDGAKSSWGGSIFNQKNHRVLSLPFSQHHNPQPYQLPPPPCYFLSYKSTCWRISSVMWFGLQPIRKQEWQQLARVSASPSHLPQHNQP